MRTSEFLKSISNIVQCNLEEKKYRKIASRYNISGYKRIYLIHIRKTGGTSLNHMFLSMGDLTLSLFMMNWQGQGEIDLQEMERYL